MIGKTKAEVLAYGIAGDHGPANAVPEATSDRDPTAQLAPDPGRNAEKIGNARDDTVLDFRNRAVGESDLPHHRDDLLAAVLIEDFVQGVGEMEEIDGLTVLRFGERDQARRRLGVEAEPALDEFA